jgi:hypothetical protein
VFCTGDLRQFVVATLIESQLLKSDALYHECNSGGSRPRERIVYVSSDQQVKVVQVAAIVSESDPTTQHWLRCQLAESTHALQDGFLLGCRVSVTANYLKWSREAEWRRPRRLNLLSCLGP